MASRTQPVHAAIRPRMCPDCPFQRSGYGRRLGDGLSWKRRHEIAETLLNGETFPCHMEAHGEIPTGPAGPQRACTGSVTVLERMGRQNLIMAAAFEYGEPPWVNPGHEVPWDDLSDWIHGHAE